MTGEKKKSKVTSDKGLLSHLYKELLKPKRKTGNPFKKWAKTLAPSQRRYTTWHISKYSDLLHHKLQIKTMI